MAAHDGRRLGARGPDIEPPRPAPRLVPQRTLRSAHCLTVTTPVLLRRRQRFYPRQKSGNSQSFAGAGSWSRGFLGLARLRVGRPIAGFHADEAYVPLRVMDFKIFLSSFRRRWNLTVFPIGIDSVPPLAVGLRFRPRRPWLERDGDDVICAPHRRAGPYRPPIGRYPRPRQEPSSRGESSEVGGVGCDDNGQTTASHSRPLTSGIIRVPVDPMPREPVPAGAPDDGPRLTRTPIVERCPTSPTRESK